MNKYCAFFKIKFLNSIQYRAPVFFAVLALVIFGIMKVFLFHSFYESSVNTRVCMDFEAIRSYVWLEGILLPLFGMWMIEADIAKSIVNGDIVYDLIKPVSLYWIWFFKNLASRVSKTCIRFIPVLIVALSLPEPYNLPTPSSIVSFFAFLLSSVLATLLLVALSMFIYIITCRMLSFSGVKSIAITLTTFLTGGVIPLPFFSDWLINCLMYTPFAYVQNVAFRVYSGDISGMPLVSSIGTQLVWAVIIIELGRWFAYKTFQRIVVQGG